jgi:uncharacterized protein
MERGPSPAVPTPMREATNPPDSGGKLLLAGGSGLIGRALAEALVAEGREVVVLTRAAAQSLPAGVRAARWDGHGVGAWSAEVEGARAVVNLAGENVGEGRWSAARKQRLRASRIEPTAALVAAIAARDERPEVFVQASAVGYYGDRGDLLLDETASPGEGFLPELGREWEGASAPVEGLGVRRVILRTGIVLAREGGALPKLLLPFRLAVGGRLGSGRQWFPWIHLADAVAAIRFLVDSPGLAGPFHLAAPQPVTNAELTRALARALRRPALLRVPAWALRVLFGEMGEVLLGGQRIRPRRLLEAGFAFRFPELPAALADLVGARR